MRDEYGILAHRHSGVGLSPGVSGLVQEKGDLVVLTKTVDLEPNLVANHQARQAPGNGFSKGRTLRHVASIPLEIYVRHPELSDPAELKKFIKRHPELCTVNAGSI